MSKLIDKICNLRDIIADKKYHKLKYCKMELLCLKEEIHRQMSKKASDYNHNLDFTAQDLRELAKDISSMLTEWSNIMNPDDNIKEVKEISETGVFNIEHYQNKVIPIMQARTISMQPLIELLNLIEYHAVFLYYLELASNDEIAIKYTERVI